MAVKKKNKEVPSRSKWSSYERILPFAFNGNHIDYERLLMIGATQTDAAKKNQINLS